MTRSTRILLIAATLTGSGSLLATTTKTTRDRWTAEERTMLASLTLASLEPQRADPSNRYADDSLAARFGRKLFFDTLLSANGKVSCATCHLPDRDFQDDRALANGVGVTGRRTMPIAGTAHSPWLFWDGRMDSQWSQALGPLESAVEHGGDRTQYARYVAAYLRHEYERVFGRLPDLGGLPAHAGPNGNSEARANWSAMRPGQRDSVTSVFVDLGKAIAAFERGVTFGQTRFDRYVSAELAGVQPSPADRFTADEEAGLRLFIGKANCVNCHNGPRLTDDHFHNTGVAVSAQVTEVDSGRTTGARQVVKGEFNCLSKHSDAQPAQCSELRFAVTEGAELVRAFKTPSLRNVADRAPFMHAGQVASLTDVIQHYDRAPRAPFGKSELKRLRLSQKERMQLESFLRTLSAPPVVTRGQ
jgi:cytochrome c peroxidase